MSVSLHLLLKRQTELFSRYPHTPHIAPWTFKELQLAVLSTVRRYVWISLHVECIQWEIFRIKLTLPRSKQQTHSTNRSKRQPDLSRTILWPQSRSGAAGNSLRIEAASRWEYRATRPPLQAPTVPELPRRYLKPPTHTAAMTRTSRQNIQKA